jgi:NADH dehydrogenase FAD-containing subunit
MLAASAVGTVETSSITESIKQANPHVLYVQGSVRAVDAEKRSITIETASSLSARGEAATETVELDYTTLVSALLTRAWANVSLDSSTVLQFYIQAV